MLLTSLKAYHFRKQCSYSDVFLGGNLVTKVAWLKGTLTGTRAQNAKLDKKKGVGRRDFFSTRMTSSVCSYRAGHNGHPSRKHERTRCWARWFMTGAQLALRPSGSTEPNLSLANHPLAIFHQCCDLLFRLPIVLTAFWLSFVTDKYPRSHDCRPHETTTSHSKRT